MILVLGATRIMMKNDVLQQFPKHQFSNIPFIINY